MADVQILTDIPYQPNLEIIAQAAHIRPKYRDEFESMVNEAARIARPKVMYVEAAVEPGAPGQVLIDGYPFKSRILAANLEGVERIYAYVATCGVELSDWADSTEDILKQFWAEQVMEDALYTAIRFFDETIDQRLGGHSASMNPGSLADWPLPQQRPLFKLFGEQRNAIGVWLTDSCMMIPSKSVSGVVFPSKDGYMNCQLCPREKCPNRREAYDPALYESRFLKNAEE